MAKGNRIAWVDCAKGIAILLVIVGHTIGMPLVKGPIFSFHMPLFFILSGYTTTCSWNIKMLMRRLKKTFCSLFVLAYVLFFLRNLAGQTTHTLRQNLAACFWASGVNFIHDGVEILMLGAPWFLVVLFWVRNLYDALHFLTKGRHMTVLSIMISTLGVVIGQRTYLPFVFDLAMASFVFYDFGQRLKSCRLQPTASRCMGSFAIWGGVPAGRVCFYPYLF